jgi:hypothetical protein
MALISHGCHCNRKREVVVTMWERDVFVARLLIVLGLELVEVLADCQINICGT